MSKAICDEVVENATARQQAAGGGGALSHSRRIQLQHRIRSRSATLEELCVPSGHGRSSYLQLVGRTRLVASRISPASAIQQLQRLALRPALALAAAAAADRRSPPPLAPAGAAAAAAAQRFDSQTACKEFSFPEEDLSFLGPLQHVTVGNQRLAWLRVAAAAPAPADADATPLLLLLGYGATMSAWGPTLLRRLAQHRDVYLFDNMAQVRAGTQAALRTSRPRRLHRRLHRRWCTQRPRAALSRRSPAAPPACLPAGTVRGGEAHGGAHTAFYAGRGEACRPGLRAPSPSLRATPLPLGRAAAGPCLCSSPRRAFPPGAPPLPPTPSAVHTGVHGCPQSHSPTRGRLVPGRLRRAQAGGAPPRPRQQGKQPAQLATAVCTAHCLAAAALGCVDPHRRPDCRHSALRCAALRCGAGCFVGRHEPRRTGHHRQPAHPEAPLQPQQHRRGLVSRRGLAAWCTRAVALHGRRAGVRWLAGTPRAATCSPSPPPPQRAPQLGHIDALGPQGRLPVDH